MTADRTSLALTTDEAAVDLERVRAELAGAGPGTDPFAAAVRATNMPIAISDPRQADNPIVFVNDAFCAMSGYDRGEIVGRNCRFLQGADTDRGPSAASGTRSTSASRSRSTCGTTARTGRRSGTGC